MGDLLTNILTLFIGWFAHTLWSKWKEKKQQPIKDLLKKRYQENREAAEMKKALPILFRWRKVSYRRDKIEEEPFEEFHQIVHAYQEVRHQCFSELTSIAPTIISEKHRDIRQMLDNLLYDSTVDSSKYLTQIATAMSKAIEENEKAITVEEIMAQLNNGKA